MDRLGDELDALLGAADLAQHAAGVVVVGGHFAVEVGALQQCAQLAGDVRLTTDVPAGTNDTVLASG